jgi:hypothetical protein
MAGLININNMNHICECFSLIAYYDIDDSNCKASMMNSVYPKNGSNELLLTSYKHLITYSDDTLMTKSKIYSECRRRALHLPHLLVCQLPISVKNMTVCRN